MAANCHTHCCQGGAELVSAVHIVAPLTSLEFHPWHVPADFRQLPAEYLELAPRAAALGECGLDRLRGATLPIQMRAFECVVEVAEKLHKPLVIHSVRCDSEIGALLKHVSCKVLIHGFSHAPRRLDALLEQGFFVSLAPYAWQKKEVAEYLKKNDFSRIGFETDDTGLAIDSLVGAAARELEIPDLDARSVAVLEAFLAK